MKALINDLLNFSRVDSKAKALVATDFNGIIDEVQHNLKEAIRESEAKIIVETKLPVILAENTQMVQLLQNFISNAIRFKGKDAPLIRVSAEEQPMQWIFMIADNGIGIQKEYFDRIFVIFQRLNNRDEYPGTGIGLAICKKIVEGLKGKISISDAPGGGTTFHLLFGKEILKPMD